MRSARFFLFCVSRSSLISPFGYNYNYAFSSTTIYIVSSSSLLYFFYCFFDRSFRENQPCFVFALQKYRFAVNRVTLSKRFYF